MGLIPSRAVSSKSRLRQGGRSGGKDALAIRQRPSCLKEFFFLQIENSYYGQQPDINSEPIIHTETELNDYQAPTLVHKRLFYPWYSFLLDSCFYR